MPDDSLWGAVKDNLILREYERGGIRLADCRGVVVDAGAHVGLFALMAGAYASRVVALEPNPFNFALLNLNILKNTPSPIKGLQLGLWTHVGELELAQSGDSGSGSFVREGGIHYCVSTTTLDDLLADLDTVDLLKLDIEGAEFEVLNQASEGALRKVRCIVAELHQIGAVDKRPGLSKRLQSLGFDVQLLPPPISSSRGSASLVVRNWEMLLGLTRLKIVTGLVYLTAGALGTFLGLQPPSDGERLSFLFARREASRS